MMPDTQNWARELQGTFMTILSLFFIVQEKAKAQEGLLACFWSENYPVAEQE